MDNIQQALEKSGYTPTLEAKWYRVDPIKIAELRMKLNLMPNDVAKKAGVSNSVTWKMESSKPCVFRKDMVLRVATALGVNMEYLIVEKLVHRPRKKNKKKPAFKVEPKKCGKYKKQIKAPLIKPYQVIHKEDHFLWWVVCLTALVSSLVTYAICSF